MYDCQLERNKLVHLHLSEQLGTASLISEYKPGQYGSHSYDVRHGLESEGRLLPARDGERYRIELFLRNDDFGEQSGEKVVIALAPDGRTRVEAQTLSGNIRRLDVGTCSRSIPD
jgi:hypothetical protein